MVTVVVDGQVQVPWSRVFEVPLKSALVHAALAAVFVLPPHAKSSASVPLDSLKGASTAVGAPRISSDCQHDATSREISTGSIGSVPIVNVLAENDRRSRNRSLPS